MNSKLFVSEVPCERRDARFVACEREGLGQGPRLYASSFALKVAEKLLAGNLPAVQLRWGDVDLLVGVLRVRDSKSEEGVRSIAIPNRLADELRAHWQRSSYRGDGERVFCHPERGSVYRAETFKKALDAALAIAGIEGRVRAFHDLRHTAITNDAASGASAIAVMTKAGHRNMATTRTYLHLAGTVFREEAERLEDRLLGTEERPEVSTQLSTQLGESESISDGLNRLTKRSGATR